MKEKRIYLILGASSDLGIRLIGELNKEKENCLFLLHYHSNADNLHKIQMLNGNKAEYFKADFSKDNEVVRLISNIQQFCEAPSYIVHFTSPAFAYKKLKQFDIDRFDENVHIQAYSLIRILQAFLPQMAKRREHNKIGLVLSSVTIGKPPKHMMEYVMVKYLLLEILKSLASDYEGRKININGVSPSMIHTKMLCNIDERMIALNAEKSAENRNADVQDIVPVIRFLLSDEAEYLHGVNINVSNGNVIG